jgi:hypothetical protein
MILLFGVEVEKWAKHDHSQEPNLGPGWLLTSRALFR